MRQRFFCLIAMLLISGLILPAVTSPLFAVEPLAVTNSDFFSESDLKQNMQVRSEIEQLLKTIETQWNAHNLEAVMSYYADDYVNNDGLDKKSVSSLTEDFWKTYPDAKSSSVTKEIRVEGNFATVESRDSAVGNTAKEMPNVGTKGELLSVSEGELYLKKVGSAWRIIGDRINYEKVRVSFGIAKQLQAVFSAPEQVKAGKQYSAKLDLNLSSGLIAVGSITSQSLQYPQPPNPTEAWRPMEATDLERVMVANNKNKNELLMATIGVTNSSRSSLMGITFLTRRLNVVPNMTEIVDTQTTAINNASVEKDKEKDKVEAKSHQ